MQNHFKAFCELVLSQRIGNNSLKKGLDLQIHFKNCIANKQPLGIVLKFRIDCKEKNQFSLSESECFATMHRISKCLRGHSITMWTRIGRWMVNRKSKLVHMNKG